MKFRISTAFCEVYPELTIEYEYTPGEPQTRDYPGCDSELEICNVLMEIPNTKELIPIPWPQRGPAYDWLLSEVQAYLIKLQEDF